MAEAMMNLRALVKKAPDADVLPEMIGFAAQRLMELEIGALIDAAPGEQSPDRLFNATAIVAATRRRGQRQWSFTSPSCVKASIFRAFWSPDAWQRKL